MSFLNKVMALFPEVRAPADKKKLSFSTKLKWTLVILISFFILSVIPLHWLGGNALQQFEQLAIILGANFGSILSLGIGPIVTASIVLQLLAGSGILKIDQTTHEGRAFFQGLQKLLAVFFIVFEAAIYVFMGGLTPDAKYLGTASYYWMEWALVIQLIIGGFLVLFMDDVINKWGFGSGISLFIAAGVSQQIFIRIFSPLNSLGEWAFGSGASPVGKIFVFVISLIEGIPSEAFIAAVSIFVTFLIFAFSVYAQSMKVEIPLSFGRMRGFGMRWPLNFLYTSNIPVILIAALLANVQLWARLFGASEGSVLLKLVSTPTLLMNLLRGTFTSFDIWHAIFYLIVLVAGSVLFSIFWMQTAGQDARSVAKQIMGSGLQIPGFRRDERIVESVLKRYILPLTVMGGISIGVLAAGADLLGALSRGTGILLAVMIIYKLYEEIAKQHMYDMYPGLRKMMGGGE
jgi:preprotein translocase subunit SecY